MSSGRTGLLGGRFDPIHVGHLDTAAAAHRALELDRVLLLPSGVSPHRGHPPRVSDTDRLAMVELAAREHDYLTACDIELGSDTPSFTAVTLARLHADGYDRTQLFFIVGADAFAEIATWHDYPTVLDGAHFVVVARPGHAVSDLAVRHPDLRDRMQGVTRPPAGPSPHAPEAGSAPTSIWPLDVTTPDVSSTYLRTCLARRQPVTGLVPAAVAAYIADRHLYTSLTRTRQ